MSGPYQFQKPLPPITNVAIQGGGIKLIAGGGLCMGLDDLGIYKDLKQVAGSSAGGILTLLMALGYSPEEIKAEMLNTDFNKFLDHNPDFPYGTGWINGLWDLGSKRAGFYKGRVFLDWARQKVKDRLGSEHATFRDLQNAIAKNAEKGTHFKGLHLTGTNYTQQYSRVFNADLSPDFEIATAARITMSYPYVFEAVAIDRETGKIILGDIPKDRPVEFYGDGGLDDNDPASVFDDPKYFPAGYRFTKFNPSTLNFRVDSSRQMKTVLWNIHVRGGVNLSSIFNVLTEDTEAARNHALNTVESWNEGVKTFDTKISKDERLKLMENARNTLYNWYTNTRVGAAYEDRTFATGYDIIYDIEMMPKDKVDFLIQLKSQGEFNDDKTLLELVTNYIEGYAKQHSNEYPHMLSPYALSDAQLPKLLDSHSQYFGLHAQEPKLPTVSIEAALLQNRKSRFYDAYEKLFECIPAEDEPLELFETKILGAMNDIMKFGKHEQTLPKMNEGFASLLEAIDLRRQILLLSPVEENTRLGDLQQLNLLHANVLSKHHAITLPVTEARQFVEGVKHYILRTDWKRNSHYCEADVDLGERTKTRVPTSVALQWKQIRQAEKSMQWISAKNNIIEIGKRASKFTVLLPIETARYYKMFNAQEDVTEKYRQLGRSKGDERPNFKVV